MFLDRVYVEDKKNERMTEMKRIEVMALVASLLVQGKTNKEIRSALFNAKGVRLRQIQEVAALLEGTEA